MEVEKNMQFEATPATGSQAPEANTATAVETPADTATAVQTQPPATPEFKDERLTPDNYAEKAKKYSKKGEKADKNPLSMDKATKPETTEKEPKTEQKEGEAGEKSTEKAPFEAKTKFTSLGKEYEIPKWAQGLIKDEETQKNFIEVFEKSMGLEHVKMRHQELSDKFTETTETHNALVGSIGELRNIYNDAVNTGNLLKLDDFFKTLQIPQNVVLNYALTKAKYMELSQEERARVDGQMNADRQAKEAGTQSQLQEKQAQEQLSQARDMVLEAWLEKPSIAPMVQAFDTAPGRKPGDFRSRVIQQGLLAWNQEQKDITPDEAVKRVIAEYGLEAQAQSQPATAQQSSPSGQATPAPKVPVVAPHRDVPTLPTIQGKGSSPLKSKPKSIEDLKKIAQAAASG